jgi:Novel toxin 21
MAEDELGDAARQHAVTVGVGGNDPSEVEGLEDGRFVVGVSHDGWMWDLTVTGNDDHDFYVLSATDGSDGTYHVEAGEVPVLVHNASCPLTNPQAKDMANRLGYRPTKFVSSGQRVFTNGETFITQDITSNSGGLWKMARSVADLAIKSTRMGTYDYDLNYIGP